MRGRWEKTARQIRSFVENPVTNLVKGIILVFIGLSDASHTFRDDLSHGQVRVGHGLILIGVFRILDTLPHFLDALEASELYLEDREKKDRAKQEADDREP